MSHLQKRLRSDEGFTLIELLVVIIIIGILLAIAVPSYLAFRGKAQDTAGASDIRAAIPSAEAYFADNNSYSGMTSGNLKAKYDSGFAKIVAVTVATPAKDRYCLTAPGQKGITWYYSGPGGGGAGTVTSSKTLAGAPC